MPALLLTTVGSNLAVTGLINVNGRVVSQRLLDYTSLAGLVPTAVPEDSPWVASEDCNHERVARIFHALAKASERLRNYYKTLAPRSLPGLGVAPHFTKFTDANNVSYDITYLERLVDTPDSQHRTVYVADCKPIDGGDTIRSVVKFTPSYNEHLHRAMEKIQGAPRLLYCSRSSSVGNLWVVVMHYIDQTGKPSTVSPEVFQRLGTKIQKMHHDQYVFGDLRRPNILIDENGELLVIDYDWSGRVGKKVYPRSINKWGIHWPTGVNPGATILIAHDVKNLLELEKDLVSNKRGIEQVEDANSPAAPKKLA